MKHVAVDAYPVLHGGPVNETPASVLADEAEGDRRIDEALARIPIDLLLSKPDDELPADIVDEAPLVRAVADEHTGAASTDELPVAGTSVPVIEEPAVVPTDASPAADSVAPAADGENDSSTDPASKLMAFLATHDIPFSDDAPLLYQVHEDLRLVRKWTSLRVLRAPKADTEEPMLLLAGEAPAQLDAVFPANSGPHPDRTRVVIPLAVSATMGASAWYRSAQRALAAVGGGRCATLALVDDDSTTAYYRVFVDWEEIVHPQWKESKSAAPDATANSASGSDS